MCVCFFNCYAAAPGPTFGNYRGDNLTNPMLITGFWQIWPKCHLELCNKTSEAFSYQSNLIRDILETYWEDNFRPSFKQIYERYQFPIQKKFSETDD